MSGSSTMPSSIPRNSSPEEVVDSLKNELLSGDEERARIAAAFIRSSYDVRDQYRRAGLGLVIMINGEVQSIDPDSPLLPDLTPLAPLVKELFPISPEKEPPGF